MYDRMKNLLLRMLSLVVSLLVIAVLGIYGTIAGVLTTAIVNDIRLDTYLGFDTGVAFVLLLVMLVYTPAYWLIRVAKD